MKKIIFILMMINSTVVFANGFGNPYQPVNPNPYGNSGSGVRNSNILNQPSNQGGFQNPQIQDLNPQYTQPNQFNDQPQYNHGGSFGGYNDYNH